MKSTHKNIRLAATIAAASLLPGLASAAIVAPYSGTDPDTLHLWQFNEPTNTSTSTAPTKGAVVLNKQGDATLGNASYSGFGSAGSTAGANTSGFLSATTQPVTTVTGAGGAFTFEALINTSTTAGHQTIFAMDNDSGTTLRPFQFRVLGGELQFSNVSNGGGSPQRLAATIPTAGADAFVANEWFHAAVTYNGAANEANNLKFYWTRVDPSRTQANLIGSALMSNDLGGNDSKIGIGKENRVTGDTNTNFEGRIDEVRVSGVARGADQMIFAVPEPSTGLLAILGAGLLLRRRR